MSVWKVSMHEEETKKKKKKKKKRKGKKIGLLTSDICPLHDRARSVPFTTNTQIFPRLSIQALSHSSSSFGTYKPCLSLKYLHNSR